MIQLGSAYGEIQIGTGDAEQSVQSLSQSMRDVGGKMSAAISLPLAAIAGAGLSAAADFEQSLNVVQQVSGATESAMATLQAQAIQLGADTSFSAGEAAEGMLELAKAGLNTEQVMAAIGGTLDLAAAGNLSVAQAAEITANALNSFNLPATEAGRVADLLAAAANSSSVEVTDMAYGFQMAGAVFASNKQPIDDLATAIAILGNNGLKGSDAGTSLKTMMMALAAPTDKASAALNALGVQVYNADGSMRGFEDIIGSLETATAGLSDAQRNAAFSTIFGSDAIRAANILVSEGADEFDRMKTAVNAQGAASEVAGARMNGLRGAIEYAKGTIESTLISAVLPFMEGLAGLVRSAADLVGSFSSLPEPVRNAALAFAAVLAAAGPLLVVIPAIAGVLGALLSPIGLIVVGVAALAAAWTSNFGGIQETTAAVWAAIQPTLQGLGMALQGLYDIVVLQAEPMGDWSYWWEQMAAVMGEDAAEAVYQIGDGLVSLGYALAAVLVPLQWVASAMLDAGVNSTEASEAITALPATLQPVASGFQTLVTAVTTGWNTLMALLEPGLQRLQFAFAMLPLAFGALQPQIDSLLAAFQNYWSALQPILQQMGMLVAAVFAVASVAAVNLFANAIEAIVPVAQAMMDQLALVLNTLADLMRAAVTLFLAVVNGDWKTANEAAQAIAETMATFIQGTWENLQTVLGTIVSAIADTVVQTLDDMGIDVKGAIDGIVAWWDDTWQGLADAVQPLLDGVAAVQKAIGDFGDWLGTISFPNPFAGISFPSMPALPSIPGFAGGTSFAPRGMALVGERGPELIDLRGGERIYDAQDTSRLLGSGEPQIVINANVASDMDVHQIAYQVAAELKRWGRR